VGRRPVLAGEGRLGEAHRPAEGARGGQGGHRPSECMWARARGGARTRGEAGELAPVEAGERSRRLPAVRMQASMHPWRSVSSRLWRPDQSRNFMFDGWPTVDDYSRGGGRHMRRQLLVRQMASGAVGDDSCSGAAAGSCSGWR
jgi:hypothetical protein